MSNRFPTSRRRLVVPALCAVVVAALALAASASADTSLSAAPGLAAVGLGPAGGYTPEDLSVAYGFSPTLNRTSQVVAVVSWFDDPRVRANLTTFDHEYGIRADTSSSFRVVDQAGKKSPLPSSSKGKHTSQQTATQVEAVRGVCNTCRIVLVEASSTSVTDVAAAERTAGRLGATEIVNALATPEKKVSKSVLAAFAQPGVVITAPAGDRGWYGMDAAFDSGGRSPGLPSFPASDPDVVAVGGTTLLLNNNGTRGGETVWNADGVEGADAFSANQGLGATGGGCSKRYHAQEFQHAAPGYAATGCAGRRLVADVAADADARNGGLDVFDSWGKSGWLTTGGDDLSAAIVGAMYALAGGGWGAQSPAAAVYENSARFPTSAFDIGADGGGNAFCDGESTATCGSDVFNNISGGTTHNPNALGAGNVDCSFPRNGSDPAQPPPLSQECNAAVGFDGPSGVGAPNSLRLFEPTNPSLKVKHPAAHAGKSETLRLTVAKRLTGTTLKGVSVGWGDGHSSKGTSLRPRHTYRKPGRYHATVMVTDNLGQSTEVDVTVKVK